MNGRRDAAPDIAPPTGLFSPWDATAGASALETPRLGAPTLKTPTLVRTLRGAHARLGIPTAADRASWQAFDLSTIEQPATDERGTPWPSTLASDFARYFRDGNRTTYESAVFARQERLTRAVLCAAHTTDAAWLDEVADGVTMLCEQSGWSWPAHDDTFERRGYVVPDAASPYVDLGAGEVVAQLAWIDHVLGDELDDRFPGLRARIRFEAEARVFGPFLDRDDWWWLGIERTPINWTPWIAGNVLTAAIILCDDEDRRARIVERAIGALNRYVHALPPDGAIDEGFSYWWNGAGRLLEALDLLARATGGVLDASHLPVLRQTLRFPMRMHLGGPWYLNVADGNARSDGTQPWHVPFRWGSITGDDEVVAHALSQRAASGPTVSVASGLGRVLHALADQEWADAGAGAAAAETAAAPAAAPLIERVWLPSVQLMLARERAGSSDGLTLAIKGGHNDEAHNHKDLGSFVVALGGVPLLVDAGRPTYSAQTFGADRYGIRVMQSGWHNTAAPFGLEQGAGREFRARVVGEPGLDHAGTDADTDALTLELAGAYPLGAGSSWRRHAELDRRAGHMTIEDTWELKAPRADGVGEPVNITADAATTVHLLVAGEPELIENRLIVRRAETASALVVEWTGATGTAEEWLLDDPQLTGSWGDRLTRVTLTAPDAERGTIRLTIGAQR